VINSLQLFELFAHSASNSTRTNTLKLLIMKNIKIRDWVLVAIIFSAGVAYIAKAEEVASVHSSQHVDRLIIT
jgi:hypothetical protein